VVVVMTVMDLMVHAVVDAAAGVGDGVAGPAGGLAGDVAGPASGLAGDVASPAGCLADDMAGPLHDAADGLGLGGGRARGDQGDGECATEDRSVRLHVYLLQGPTDAATRGLDEIAIGPHTKTRRIRQGC
jgi:hypothetical protein